MGQRTAIVLIYERDVCSLGLSFCTTRVFYNQWGIGRVMPASVMQILNGLACDLPGTARRVEGLCPTWSIDDTDNKCYSQNPIILERVGFDSPESFGTILRDFESNNNGGVLIHVKVKYDENFKVDVSIRYAFMLGYEEGGDYKSFCSKETYLEEVGGRFVDEKFRKMFDATLAYWDAEDMGAK